MSVLTEWEVRQLAALKHEIAARLRPVCADDSPESFDAFVDRAARIQRKFDQQRFSELFPLGERGAVAKER